MTRDEAFEFLDRTARGIAEMFGSSCETLVHDFNVPGHPILSIYNGQVSGRTVGDTTAIMGIDLAIDDDAMVTDLVNMSATTPDGHKTKSSTFHLIGDGYNLALGINFDYTPLAAANRVLVDLMSTQSDLQSALWQDQDSRQLASLFERCLAAVGKPVTAMDKNDRLQMVALLEQHNAFSFRKSVPYVSKNLGVSRYTVYKYLSEVTGRPMTEQD
ncbi:MAG: helix-turn-helix transcriptional regulator [Oscillospiraceae bacterium]|nr:helix-turn-helix transcriptional regulator [Oscillospiraceae bacterium]